MIHKTLLLALLLGELVTVSAQSPGPRPVRPATAEQDKLNALPLYPFEGEFRYWSLQLDRRMDSKLRKAISELYTYYMGTQERGVDEKGRPNVSHERFTKLREKLVSKLAKEAGWLTWILKDSRNVNERRLAAFALFFAPETQIALWGVAYGAYEPRPVLRRQFLAWALPWVKAQLQSRFTQEDAENVYPPTPENRARVREGNFRHELVYVHQAPQTLKKTVLYWGDTWLNLMRAPESQDRVLALQMLEILAQTRPAAAAKTLLRGEHWIRANLIAKNEAVRRAARNFVTALDPKHPCPEDKAAVNAHLDALMERLFPPVEIQGALALLYDGPELDAMAKLINKMLATGRFGYTARGEVQSMGHKRTVQGVKLNVMPELLQRLGLETGMLIHTVDGTPVRSCEQLLAVLQSKAKAKATSLVIEYLDPEDRPGMRRYLRKGPRRR
ncbi:MAG: hypothetical protein CSA62_02605 [Planctomycetota bacterium]|nr:MAG: hypothetical protein CSA62_02605 [Planctomycetota bacterium]